MPSRLQAPFLWVARPWLWARAVGSVREPVPRSNDSNAQFGRPPRKLVQGPIVAQQPAAAAPNGQVNEHLVICITATQSRQGCRLRLHQRVAIELLKRGRAIR